MVPLFLKTILVVFFSFGAQGRRIMKKAQPPAQSVGKVRSIALTIPVNILKPDLQELCEMKAPNGPPYNPRVDPGRVQQIQSAPSPDLIPACEGKSISADAVDLALTRVYGHSEDGTEIVETYYDVWIGITDDTVILWKQYFRDNVTPIAEQSDKEKFRCLPYKNEQIQQMLEGYRGMNRLPDQLELSHQGVQVGIQYIYDFDGRNGVQRFPTSVLIYTEMEPDAEMMFCRKVSTFNFFTGAEWRSQCTSPIKFAKIRGRINGHKSVERASLDELLAAKTAQIQQWLEKPKDNGKF